jgi:hypothetical protein
LVIRIPMRSQRRGGDKHYVALDGSAIMPTSRPQPQGTLVKDARAGRWHTPPDDGVLLWRAEWMALGISRRMMLVRQAE